MTEAVATYRPESAGIDSDTSAFNKVAPVSVLELFHPDGLARCSLTLGSGCPSDLISDSNFTTAEPALIVLAPTVNECRMNHWLRYAVQSISQKLARDGVAYVLAPPLWRTTIKRLLKQCGFFTECSIIHLPNTASTRYLVPLAPGPLSYVLSQSLPFARWRSPLVAARARLTVKEAVCENLVLSLAFVMRRVGARPIFNWLSQMHSRQAQDGPVLIRRSWRGRNGAVIVYEFGRRHSRPWAIAKLNLGSPGSANRLGEANNLAGLGPDVKASGARVPELLSVGRLAGAPVLIESAIAGQPFAKLLRAHPPRVTEVLERITAWLERWNRQTAVVQPLNHNLIERDILGPAASLTPILKPADEYRHWLQMRCARVTSTPCPLVATHNDLTMWNVFRDGQQAIGIIDWETAQPTGLPLVDFFYAVVDGVAATQNRSDRLKAFQACFTPGGGHESAIHYVATRLKQVVPTPGDILELAFHSCWLHHAANEYRSSGKPHGEFIKIAQWLAANRAHISPWIRE